jgi:hypothetical protein
MLSTDQNTGLANLVAPSLKAGGVGLVNDKAQHLALLDVVETHNTDVGTGVLRTASAYFTENFLSARGAKQRQLPQSPVVLLRIRIFAELYSRNVALVEDVLELSGDLSIRQRRKVGQGFVTTLFG